MPALEKAEKRMFDVAGQLGMDGDRVVQVGSYGPKSDCSQKEGLDAFGGWVARTPAEITAEHFHLGKYKFQALATVGEVMLFLYRHTHIREKGISEKKRKELSQRSWLNNGKGWKLTKQ